eukprot:6483174-Amphidinium_carterae.1
MNRRVSPSRPQCMSWPALWNDKQRLWLRIHLEIMRGVGPEARWEPQQWFLVLRDAALPLVREHRGTAGRIASRAVEVPLPPAADIGLRRLSLCGRMAEWHGLHAVSLEATRARRQTTLCEPYSAQGMGTPRGGLLTQLSRLVHGMHPPAGAQSQGFSKRWM